MRRHTIPAEGGRIRVGPASDGAAIVLELFGPRGGFRAGIGIRSEASPALTRALRSAKRDADAIAAELREADELARSPLNPDTDVRCERCGREERVSFAIALASGWPLCCGQTMRVVATTAAVPELVQGHVLDAARERDLAEVAP